MTTKLAGLAPPAWTPYHGVSVLYDPPGCAAVGGVERLERLATSRAADHDLLLGMRALADRIDATARAEGVGLGLLPAHSYHVTLCDAVHAGVTDQVAAEHRPAVAALLEALPDSLLCPDPVLGMLRDPELLFAVRRDPVTYRPEGLHAWGHALVVALAPADERSRRAHARHAAARGAFVERLHARLGVTVQAWRPHLTLGYFAADRDVEQARQGLLPAWQELLRDHAGGATVTFRSAAVHGFTDMATFWRLGQ